MFEESQFSSRKVRISREVAKAQLFDLLVESVLRYPNHSRPKSENGYQSHSKQQSYPDTHLTRTITLVRFDSIVSIVNYILGPRRVNLHV